MMASLRPYMFILIPLGSVWFFNAFAGVVCSWVPLYLMEAGHGMREVYISAIVMALGGLMGGLSMAGLLTFFGRLPLLRLSLVVVAALCLSMGFVSGGVGLTAMLWFVELTKTGVINVLYTYTPEAFPTRIRSTAFGICSGLHRLAPALSPFLVSFLMDHFNFTVLCGIFAGLFVTACLLSFLMRVETFGVALVEDTPPGGGKKEAPASYGAVARKTSTEYAVERAADAVTAPVPMYRRVFCGCGKGGKSAAGASSDDAAPTPRARDGEDGGPVTNGRRSSVSVDTA